MGLFNSGKSAEDKAFEKIAKALEEMVVHDKDGLVHVGCFEGSSGLTSYKSLSLTMNGVAEFLQKNDREVIDVRVSPCGSGDTLMSQLVTVVYR